MARHPKVFQVTFEHSDAPHAKAAGIEWKDPDIRFVVANDIWLVEAWCSSIKWMWGSHRWAIEELGDLDRTLLMQEEYVP